MYCFVRVSPILEVVAGGRVFGTTGEHPFWVVDKGWVAAGSLEVGDLLGGSGEGGVRVESVRDTGRVETVYNVEVEGDHTYFVGDETEWGFDVWVHNDTYTTSVNAATRGFRPIRLKAGGQTYVITTERMRHFLARHHPKYFDLKKAKEMNSMFGKGETVSSISEKAIKVFNQNLSAIKRVRFPQFKQFQGEVNGVLYQLGVRPGSGRGVYIIGQFHPIS